MFLCHAEKYSYDNNIAEVGDIVEYEYDDEPDDDGEAKVMD